MKHLIRIFLILFSISLLPATRAFADENLDRMLLQNADPETPRAWERKPVRYRGFLNVTTAFGVTSNDIMSEMVSTTHGVQVTQDIFAGAGIGVSGWGDINHFKKPQDYKTYIGLPVFACFRGDLHRLLNKHVVPYFDTKIGYSFIDVEGVYFTPELGVHLYFGRSLIGLSLGLCYQLQQCRDIAALMSDREQPVTPSSDLIHALGVSIAIDF